jgi:hypothetical protein
MYILWYFDWFGPIEELDEWEKKLKKLYDGSDGVELLGRFVPHNQKFHWTRIYKAKDFNAWVNRKMLSQPFKRDIKVMTHALIDYYT